MDCNRSIPFFTYEKLSNIIIIKEYNNYEITFKLYVREG